MTSHGLSAAWILVGLLARGIGQGATGIPTIAAAYAAVPRRKLGLATTAVNIVQRLGGPIATTLLAVIVSISVKPALATGVPGGPHSGDAATFVWPFLALIALQLGVLASAVRLPARIPQIRED